MIQRIQSLYLLLTTLISLLFLKGGILNFSDSSSSGFQLKFNGIYNSSGLIEKNWIITILAVIISLLAAIIIALFKKRELQLMLSRLLIFLILGFIFVLVYFSYSIATKYSVQVLPGFKMAVPVLQLIFSFLAYRGIKKDDDLVKSYDRLR
jgi:hypothetical protein